MRTCFLTAGLARPDAVNLAVIRLLATGFSRVSRKFNIGAPSMGLLVGRFSFQGETTQNFWLFLTAVVPVGFPTFSIYALNLVLLWDRNSIPLSLLYAVSRVVI
jgi:fluoride ion exporter CrcB/FEX